MENKEQEPCNIKIWFNNKPTKELFGAWISANDNWVVVLDYVNQTSYSFKTSSIDYIELVKK